MWEDPIVNEVRQAREKILEECDYDIDKLFERIKKSEEEHKKQGWKFVTKADLGV